MYMYMYTYMYMYVAGWLLSNALAVELTFSTIQMYMSILYMYMSEVPGSILDGCLFFTVL